MSVGAKFPDLQTPVPFEIVAHVIYDSMWIHSGLTDSLNFFDVPATNSSRNNIVVPNMLPSPQSFLIERIRVWDVSNDVRLGQFQLDIGAKRFLTVPLMALAGRGLNVVPRLMIPPSTTFRASIRWSPAPFLGRGLSGELQQRRPIQVGLRGQLARPLM